MSISKIDKIPACACGSRKWKVEFSFIGERDYLVSPDELQTVLSVEHNGSVKVFCDRCYLPAPRYLADEISEFCGSHDLSRSSRP